MDPVDGARPLGNRSGFVASAGSVKRAPVAWEYSRATPRMEKQ